MIRLFDPDRAGSAALLLYASLFLLSAAPAEKRSGSFLRGMVISCPRAGEIWGSQEMRRSLKEISKLGVDWIAIHPYARVQRDGAIRFRSTEDTAYLERAAALSREAGVQLFWKPHLAYWGSFEWRGAIQFGDDEAAWQRFFSGYRQFIVDQARFAESVGVDLFAVGVESENTTHRETEWRQIIAAVRSVYSGRLTYAANWDRLDQVPFWDAVDLIGVHGYFPLASGNSIDRQALWQGWDAPLASLSSLSRSLGGKPVLFAEIGYSRSASAASEPWIPQNDDRPEVRSLRQTLIEVALERIEAESYVAGMFWWKWIPGDDRWDRDFSMKDVEARQALERYWTAENPTVPTAR